MPLAVSHLRFCFGVGLTAVLVVQLLELSDFSAKIPNLFTKHCEMIHDNRIAHSNEFFKRKQENDSGATWFSFFLRSAVRMPGQFGRVRDLHG